MPTLHPQHAAKSPPAKIRVRTIVIHKHPPIAPITKKRPAKFSYIRGRLHPTRRFRVELAQLLQLSIFLFRQDLDAMARATSMALFFGLNFFRASNASRS